VREAQRWHVARVTFPQRLLYGAPLRGGKYKTEYGIILERFFFYFQLFQKIWSTLQLSPVGAPATED
jgi:hypothetical protein